MSKPFQIFRKLMKILKHSLFVSWLLYISVVVTLIIYYWFYTWYMPSAKSESNIMFELQHKTNPNFIKKQQYELVGIVDLFDDNGQLLHTGQDYSFTLNMDVPESESNFEIGIFGITADLYDVEGKLSASFKTTGTLKYRSILLRCILTFIQIPLFLFGYSEQKQVLSFVLKDNYVDNSYTSANKLIIKIHDKLQFYKATLLIEAKFTGLKYYLHNWYYTTTAIICTFMVVFVFLILITNFYDVKSFVLMNFSSKKSQTEKTIQIFESDHDKNIAFVSTTTRQLKSFLDNNNDCYDDESNILIGIENFRRHPSYPSLKMNKKKQADD